MSYISQREFTKGLDCWRKTFEFRSSPRKLPQEELPNIISEHVRPEWATREEVDRIEQDVHSTYGILNLVHQACLVRHRLCKSMIKINETDALFWNTRWQDSQKDFTVQLILLLLEWREFYTLRSRKWLETYMHEVCKFIDYFIKGKNKSQENCGALLIVLKKVVTSLEELTPLQTSFHAKNPVFKSSITSFADLCKIKEL